MIVFPHLASMLILISSIVVSVSSGSVVRDSHADKNKLLDEYCPKSEHCEEGSHVMCMYYNPSSVMGPQCHNSRDLHITADEAVKFLDLTNLIRGYIAKGEETGQDGVKLPRAYGMMRLEWDEELATFAQVLANQCILRHDLCRASKKFPEPGQTAGIVRFSYPDWYSITGSENFTAGLSDEKLVYSIHHIIETWYSLKSSVTPDMLTNYPDWTINTDKAAGRLYLEMINGKSTHLGCGISAYADYAYHANNADLTYNNVQVICNFSTRTRIGEKVYNVEPPTENDIGYTLRCGCPVGYDEDVNCLCYRSDRRNPKSCENDQCKPSVVLLPIFTVEDAPAHKMIHSQGYLNNTLSLVDSFEILQHFDKFTKKPFSRKIPHKIFPKDLTHITQRTFKEHNHVNIGRRYFDKPTTKKSYRYTAQKRIILPSLLKKRRSGKSIFSRTARFQLPKKKLVTKAPTRDLIKKDVVPRKDFSILPKLVTNYLNRRKSNGNDYYKILNEEMKYVFNNSSLYVNEITTEKYLTTTVNVINFNQYIKDKNFNNVSDRFMFNNSHTNDADKNVLSLLNDLKTKVKYVDFVRKEKEIFDAKIRQIYDTLAENHFEDKSRNNSVKSKHKTIDELKSDELKDENKKFPHNRNDGRYNRRTLEEKKEKTNIRRENDLKREFKYSSNKINEIYGVRRRNKDFYRRNNNESYKNNYYLRKDNIDEVLSSDRRRYYQEKLDNLERKLHNMRGNRRENVVPDDRHVRRIKPTNDGVTRRLEESNVFYMPDRARFLHGFK